MNTDPTLSELLMALGRHTPVSPADKKLHENLIRLLKGVIKSWEEWVRSQ